MKTICKKWYPLIGTYALLLAMNYNQTTVQAGSTDAKTITADETAKKIDAVTDYGRIVALAIGVLGVLIFVVVPIFMGGDEGAQKAKKMAKQMGAGLAVLALLYQVVATFYGFFK